MLIILIVIKSSQKYKNIKESKAFVNLLEINN